MTRQPGGPAASPHDALFRRVFGEPANAASELAAVLPQAWAARLDLDQLRQVSGSFIDDELKATYSDLLFTAPLAGRPALIYVLIEHQSSEDPLMALRMLRYVVSIWQAWLRGNRNARRLPPVFPLVVHHGRRAWASPVQLRELIDLDPLTDAAAGDWLPRFRFGLDDLADVDEQALAARPLTRSAAMTLLLLKKVADNSQLVADLQRWADQLHAVLEQPRGIHDFSAMLTYILKVGEVPAAQFRDLMAAIGPDAEEAYMTTAEMLRAEGEARGRAEGEARGRAEGEARGRAETLLQQLELKFGKLPKETPQNVRAAPVRELRTWTARVLTAKTLEEVFR